MNPMIAKILIGGGLLLVIAVIVYYFFGDKLTWLGRLPGDIRYESERTKIYFPITTMVLVSLLINGIILIAKKFF